jgi:hypothetical protein
MLLKIPVVDISQIPKGLYCWDKDNEGNIKVCPYYGKIEEHYEGGYCALKGYADWQDDMGLLWDQVKECDHNLED